MDRCWILVGMMGAGKSAVGRTLATLSGRQFVDTDAVVQNKLGRPIPQIFALYGEKAFRDHETRALKELQPSQTVVSTGGGIVLAEENWTEMRRLGIVVYLSAKLETLEDRLERSKKKRPLIDSDNWREKISAIYSFRQNLYERADFEVPVDDAKLDDVARMLLQKLGSQA